mgnify:CR=1 FL=1
MKKTWKEKLNDDKDMPKVVELNEKLQDRWKAKTCAIAAPREIDAIMKQVPKGKLITINQIREKIAEKHHADIACPITTGIFARIAAEAAEEDRNEGVKEITPYWRTLKAGGVINPKYPGGEQAQKQLLEAEGHEVHQKGKKFVVVDYEKALI